jgi:tetratricopeptide (TPR) repeat protein
MRRPRSFLAVWTRAVLSAAASLALVVASAAPAKAADKQETAAPRPSLSPLEWNRSLVARGRVSEKLGQNEDAMADYTLAIESHALPPDEQARALFDRGLLLDGLSRLDEALADYSASLALAPNFAAALNNRGNVYRRLGRSAEARRDYLAALQVGNPQSQYSYYGLGEITAAEGSKAEAKEFYAKALAADPKYDLARDRLAALSSGEQMVRLEPPVADVSASPNLPPIPSQDDLATPIVLHPPVGTHGRIRRHADPAPSHAGDIPLKPSLESPRGTGLGQVQLGAWRSEAEANEGWDHAVRQAGDTLKGFSPRIVAVELPKVGRYYRLRVAAGQEGAKDLCAALAAKGLDCMPVRD